MTRSLKPSELYRRGEIEHNYAITIDSCMEKIPPGKLSQQDALLFVGMLRAILTVPTELCYQYANKESNARRTQRST